MPALVGVPCSATPRPIEPLEFREVPAPCYSIGVDLLADVEHAIRAAAGVAPFDFEGLALRVFTHQYAQVAPYRQLCDRRGISPTTVVAWTDIPPVPTRAFRYADLNSAPPEAIFRTSGTSDGPDARGRHLVPRLSLYRAAALPAFERFVLGDGARLRCLFLLPDPQLRPDSSLVHMCDWVAAASGTPGEWFVDAQGLDVPRLVARLAAAQTSGEAILLAGPTAGFVHLFETGGRFRLGPGSRVMDTGGAKGMTRPWSRAGFLRACWTHLGIPGYFCINEYGMTELCSQRYDSALDDRLHGRSLAPRRLVAPPWLRTRVLDPDTLAPVAAGATGLLCHHDLANAGSVAVVLTEDLGRTVGGDGIEVLGRVPGAVPRGCGQLLAAMEPR